MSPSGLDGLDTGLYGLAALAPRIKTVILGFDGLGKDNKQRSGGCIFRRTGTEVKAHDVSGVSSTVWIEWAEPQLSERD